MRQNVSRSYTRTQKFEKSSSPTAIFVRYSYNTQHSTMTTTSSSLEQAYLSCSKWKPSILLKSTHFTTDTKGVVVPVVVESTSPTTVDIINLLDSYVIDIQLQLHCQLTLQYPENAAFQLEGFQSIHDYNKVIHYIRQCCKLGHTSIVVSSSKKFNAATGYVPFYII